MPQRLTSIAALVLTGLASTDVTNAAPQCTGWMIDTAAPNNVGARGAMSDDIVAMARHGGGVAPSVGFYRHDPVRDDFILEAHLDDPGWNSSWRLTHLALKGDLVAFQPRGPFGSSQRCVIGERAAGHWRTTTVHIGSNLWINSGQLTALSWSRVVTLTTELLPPRHFVLNVIERDSSGEWALAEQVVSRDTTAGWFENQGHVVLEGDIAAYTKGGIVPAGTVVVVERDAGGTWHETNLPPPMDTGYLVSNGRSLAIDGDRIAVVLRKRPRTDQVETLIYRRVALGDWAFEQRIVTRHPQFHWGWWASLAMGDGRLAITMLDVTRHFEQDAQGQFVLVREYEGLGDVFAVNAARIAGGWGRGIRIARADPGTPLRNVLCDRFGATICRPLDPRAPILHLIRDPDPVSGPGPTAEIMNGTPGAPVQVFITADPERRLLAVGQLCLGSSALRSFGPPAPLDASGRATIVMPRATIAAVAVGADTIYTQAIVLGVPSSLTNAVRFVSY